MQKTTSLTFNVHMQCQAQPEIYIGEGGIEFVLLPFLPSKLADVDRPIFIQKFLGVQNITTQLLNTLTVSTLVVLVHLEGYN